MEPLNATRLLIVVASSIPSQRLNITFLFKLPSNTILETLNYTVVNESKTQTGYYAYLLDEISTSQYNPSNTSYIVCDIGYKFENKNIKIINSTNC